MLALFQRVRRNNESASTEKKGVFLKLSGNVIM